MKNLIKLLPVAVLVVGLSISGCKKDNNSSSTTDTNSMQQLAKDNNQVQSSSDEVLNDVNDAVSPHAAAKSGGNWWTNSHCNATLDSITSGTVADTLNFTYSGLNCNGTLNRSGHVQVVRLKNIHWKDQGASVTVNFINLSVTKVSSQKTFVLNGTKTYTNFSGGLLIQLGNGLTSLVHEVSGSLNIKFDDGTTRTWSVARRKTFTGTFNISTLTFLNLAVTVEGLGSSNGYANLDSWGTNRNGEAFYTQINSGIVFRQDCNWKPVGGILVHQIPSDSKKATLTFGYDSSNNLTTVYNNVTEYKLDWVKRTKSGSMFIQLAL